MTKLIVGMHIESICNHNINCMSTWWNTGLFYLCQRMQIYHLTQCISYLFKDSMHETTHFPGIGSVITNVSANLENLHDRLSVSKTAQNRLASGCLVFIQYSVSLSIYCCKVRICSECICNVEMQKRLGISFKLKVRFMKVVHWICDF